MEPDGDTITDIAERNGLDEREARILYHLNEASNLYYEIAEQEDYGYGTDPDDWNHHHHGLIRLLTFRVARKDHPEGWRATGEREEAEQAEADSSP